MSETQNILEVFLENGDGTAKQLGAAVRCVGLYATEDELNWMAGKYPRSEFFQWICEKEREKEEVMGERMIQRELDAISEHLKDPKWTSLQKLLLNSRMKCLQSQYRARKLQIEWQQKDWRIKTLEASVGKGERPHVSGPVAEPVYQRLSAAWTAKYIGTKALHYLLLTLDKYVNEWQTNLAYAAPLTSIVQSSGWGKSRSLCELSSKGVCVVYISFSERAIPHGTPGAKAYFTGVQNNVRKVGAAFVGCLDHLASQMEKGQSLQQLIVKQTSKEENIWSHYHWGSSETAVAGLPECKYMDVTSDAWNDEDLEAWIKGKMMELEEKFHGKVRGIGLKVLFCLDEAGELFQLQPTLFMVMQRAFSCFPRSGRVFAVLVDTSAKLRMLAPARMANPSLKGRLPETKVFAPLCIAGVAHFNSDDLISSKCGVSDFDDTVRVLFAIGRPLWAACLNADKGSICVMEAITYATQKLLGGTSLTDVLRKTTLDESMAVGILSASIGLEVAAWSELAETLVASHMRTAMVVSEERDRIFTADVAEPILGEAAARLLCRSDLLLKVLVALERVCKEGFDLEGPRGGLIGRIILMLAMYNCQQDGKYSQPVLLQNFLSKVCGKEVKCAKGNVFFNRCCVVSGDLTQDVLLKCYLGCFAIIPRRNQEGFDFVIPLLFARSDHEFELSAANMGAIPCRFRDRDSYTINWAQLALWARHFAFSGYSRKRLRQGECSSKDDFQQMQEVVAMEQCHIHSYVKYLTGDPEDDATYDQAVMDLQAQFDARMVQISEANKERRCQSASSKEESDAQKQRMRDSIGLSKEIGLYLHLNSQTRSTDKWVAQIENTIILHGVQRYTFLNDSVKTKLEDLRIAYHRLEQVVKSDEEVDCLKSMVWPFLSQVKT